MFFLTKNLYTETKKTLNLMYEPIVFNENDIEICSSKSNQKNHNTSARFK